MNKEEAKQLAEDVFKKYKGVSLTPEIRMSMVIDTDRLLRLFHHHNFHITDSELGVLVGIDFADVPILIYQK